MATMSPGFLTHLKWVTILDLLRTLIGSGLRILMKLLNFDECVQNYEWFSKVGPYIYGELLYRTR